MRDLIQLTFDYCRRVKNRRTIRSAFDHMVGECNELDVEITLFNTGMKEGDDGVVGEAVDVIACALDIIWQRRPDMTSEELCAIMDRKCAKWERKVAEGAYESDRMRSQTKHPTKVGQFVRLLPDETMPMDISEHKYYPNSTLNLVGGQLDRFRVVNIKRDDDLDIITVEGDFRGLDSRRFEVIE